MDRPKFGTNQHEERVVSIAAERDPAFDFAQSLMRRERAKGVNYDDALPSIAHRLRIGAGTFANIVKARVKRVDGRLRDRLRALLVRELEAEITRLAHELEIARQSGAHLASEQVGEIETHLAAVRSILAAPSRARADLESCS
jgi:hypothetical protein